MHLRIALWGYGRNGKKTEKLIDSSLSSRYDITAVFDQRGDGNTTLAGRRIESPDLIARRYKEGLFSSVFITVCDPMVYAKMRGTLEMLGIQVLPRVRDVTFEYARNLEQTQASISVTKPGYEFHALAGARMSVSKDASTAFVHGSNGSLIRDYWADYGLEESPLCNHVMPDEDLPVAKLPGEWCMLARPYSHNYWHYTYETLDKACVLEDAGYKGRYVLPRTEFSDELTALFGLDPSRVMWLEDFDRSQAYEFETLLCLELKLNDRSESAPMVLETAERILSSLPPSTKPYPRRVFVKRIGTRQLDIPQQLLDRYGFVTVIPEDLSVSEQVRVFHEADIVLTPHGANSTNSIYMRPGTAFIETFPMGYVNPCCLETLSLGGVRYLMAVETVSGEQVDLRDIYRNYYVHEGLLASTIQCAIDLLDH